MIAVVILWVLLQTVGWSLIYLPHVPDGFSYSAGIEPANYPNSIEALYMSLVTLVTLGFGDVVATDPWIRIATPLEALIGFALLTAALTWFTQIYAPLSRRRALALELKSLAEVNYAERIGDQDPTTAARVLDGLTAEVMKARIDFTQHSETYYFQEEDPQLSLAREVRHRRRFSVPTHTTTNGPRVPESLATNAPNARPKTSTPRSRPHREMRRAA